MPLIIKVINPLNYYTGISGSVTGSGSGSVTGTGSGSVTGTGSGSVTGTGSSGVERVRLWFPFITY
jgi:hypothetical protein